MSVVGTAIVCMVVLLVAGVIVCGYLYSRGDEFDAVDGGRLVEPPPRVFRQRYQCRACGWHGTRELMFPPSWIRCIRCHGSADASGSSELVT
jgi:hypothetical protein